MDQSMGFSRPLEWVACPFSRGSSGSRNWTRVFCIAGRFFTNWDIREAQPRQHIKKQRHYFPSKGPSSQGCGFSSRHVWMWELDYKESWALKNDAFELWCWRGLLRVPWTEIKPVNPKGNQSWIFIARTDAKAETPILWPPDEKNRFIGKVSDAGNDWRWEEKGMTEDEMVGWPHRLHGHVFK